MADKEFIQDGVGDNGSMEFEQLLEQFAPRASNVSSARVMFLAGRESAVAAKRQRASWAWPLATAAMAVVAISCAVVLATRASQAPEIVERIVYVRDRSSPADNNTQSKERPARPVEQSGSPDLEDKPQRSHESRLAFSPRHSTYFAARRAVLSGGIDAMPIVPVSRWATYKPMLSLGSYRNDMLSQSGVGSDISNTPLESINEPDPNHDGDKL
jgi:hypothetical protein